MAAKKRRPVNQPGVPTGITSVNWDMVAPEVAQAATAPVPQTRTVSLPGGRDVQPGPSMAATPVTPTPVEQAPASFEPTPTTGGGQTNTIGDPNDTLTSRILNGLAQFGIGDRQFASDIATAIADGRLDERSGTFLDDVGVVLADNPYLKTRFPANVTRKTNGLQPLPLSEILELENGYITAMQAANMPPGFYDDPATDLQNLIARNVSVAEVQRRINQGYAAVRDADPELRRQFKELYGVTDATLAAYFLDPARMESQLTRQMESAQVAQEARRVAGTQLTTAQAEELQGAGVTAERARAGFGTIAQQQGLFQAQMAGEQEISQQEQIAGTFGLSAEASQRIATRQRRRQAEFEAGGGFSQANQYGVSGLGSANR